VTRLQRLRIFLGIPTVQDRKDAEIEMWRNIRTTAHHEDLRDAREADEHTSLADVTRRERPSRRW
jgi:hypothetical protein